MRGLRTIPSLIGAVLVTGITATGPVGCVVEPRGVVYARYAPPPPEIEVATVSPGGGYVWVAGHHAWRGEVYVWVPGRWERPPHPHTRWVHGHWHHNSHGWYWIDGRWS